MAPIANTKAGREKEKRESQNRNKIVHIYVYCQAAACAKWREACQQLSPEDAAQHTFVDNKKDGERNKHKKQKGTQNEWMEK